MNDTIYRGMRVLVYVALGKTAYSNDSEYLKLKNHFRYPGEVLERMEQYGYSSDDDYISAMGVVLWMKETLSAKQMEEMFVGTQLEDFVKRTKEKAGDNLYLLYELYLYEKSGRKQILTAVSKTPLETTAGFLDWMTSDRLFLTVDYSLAKDIVLHMDGELKALNRFDAVKDADLFIHLIKFAFRLVCHTGDSRFKSDEDYKRLGLTGPLIALKSLYAEPVRKSSQKVLEQMGFSEMDILNLNCGIWLIKDQKPYCCNSEIKWWRLKKRWFQSLFVQKEEITIKPVIEKMMEKEMPRKIDGEDLTREFYLEGFSAEIPDTQNSYLLFDLLTRRSDNNVFKWKYICKNHDLSVMGDAPWLKGLLEYLNPREISFNRYVSTGADRNKQIYATVIKNCENLEEKQEVFKEIFQKDVKEFIYQNSGFFEAKFLDSLFISDFLDMDRYYKENSYDAAEYLKNMEYPFQLSFLQKFCEDRNWQFTSKEAEFLKTAVNSWMVSLAYSNKSTDTCFQRFSSEEKKLLLGLVCELCVRISHICRLDLLMAGLIANTETRLILGEEISQEWYRILKQRDFGYQDALDRDFLSTEAYQKIQKQKEEQKEKERQDREAREVEIRKASLEEELQGLTVKEAVKVFAGKVPPFVFSDRERTLASLEVYKEHFEDKEIFAEKKVICKLMKFFLDCYENNYITKPVLMNKLGLLKED